jgi:hypothetical protein
MGNTLLISIYFMYNKLLENFDEVDHRKCH